MTWVVRVPHATKFRVAANYNTLGKDNTGTFMLAAAGQTLTGKVTPTENISTFRTDPFGELTLPAGEHTIVIRATEIAGGNLTKRITLGSNDEIGEICGSKSGELTPCRA